MKQWSFLGFPGNWALMNPPANAGDVGSLGWNDPLEKEIATYSNILAWEIPGTEESGWLQSMGSWRFRHNLATEQQQWSFHFVLTYSNVWETNSCHLCYMHWVCTCIMVYIFVCMCVLYVFVVVQLLSCVWLFVTPWTIVHQASLWA